MVDFECVPLGSSSYRTVVVKNISSVPVIYKWVWVEDIDERFYETSVVRFVLFFLLPNHSS